MKCLVIILTSPLEESLTFVPLSLKGEGEEIKRKERPNALPRLPTVSEN
jgi:hypothetical protein